MHWCALIDLIHPDSLKWLGWLGSFRMWRHCFLTIVHAFKVMLLQAEMSGKMCPNKFLSSSKTHQSCFLKPLALNTLGFWWSVICGMKMDEMTSSVQAWRTSQWAQCHQLRVSTSCFISSAYQFYIYIIHPCFSSLGTLFHCESCYIVVLNVALMLCWSNECTSPKSNTIK